MNRSRGRCFAKPMSPEHEIDYEALIDRSINDFEPVKRLWPAGLRLACWILLEAAILGLAVWLRGYANLPLLLHHVGQLAAAALFLSASIAAAFMALKSAIPGREPSWPGLAITIAMIAGAFGFAGASAPSVKLFAGAPTALLQLSALGALPWLSLFWAVRRGVPIQPEVSGGTVGLAAFCFALALDQIVNQPLWIANAGLLPAVTCTVAVIIVSALAGRWWLNWIARWQQPRVATEI